MFPSPLRPGAFGARRIQVEHKKCLAAAGRCSLSASRGFLGSKELTLENIKFSKNQCETGACATTFCAVPTPAPSRPSATRSAWAGGSAGSRPSSRSVRARDTRKGIAFSHINISQIYSILFQSHLKEMAVFGYDGGVKSADGYGFVALCERCSDRCRALEAEAEGEGVPAEEAR